MMKKAIAMFLVAGMLFALSLSTGAAGLAEEGNAGRQAATGWLDQEGNEIHVTVELTGGWSVEFAHGAVYLFDGDYSEDSQAVAVGMTLEREVFEEYCAEAAASETFREIDGAQCYTQEDGTTAYLTRVGDDACFMLCVNEGVEGDAVFARLTLRRYAASEGDPESVGMANPWTGATTADEAAEGAGVGYFAVPEENAETARGPVNWYGFRYMEHIAEADGAIGVAELTVRKGLRQDTQDVSGDYTEYALEWTVEADGWQVTCFGNEEGKAMKAIWLSDNFSYSIMVRGQGDAYDTYGLDDETIAALVTMIQ